MVIREDFFDVRPEVLKRYVNFSIPKNLIPTNWKCTDKDPLKNLENLLTHSDGKLYEYGSNAEAFMKYLKSHVEFPGSWSFFKLLKTDVYNNDVTLSTSLGKKSHFYKRNIYSMIQYWINTDLFKPLESEIAISMFAYYLKTHELKTSPSEMIETNPWMCKPLLKSLRLVNNMFLRGEWKCEGPKNLHFNQMSLEEAVGAFTPILHDLSYEESGSEQILALLEKYSEKLPMKENSLSYYKILTWLGLVCARIGAFIDTHPHIFKTSIAVQKPTPGSKIIVRLIHVKEEKVVLVHELYQRVKTGGFDVYDLEEMVQGISEVGTITFRQVFEILPKDLMKSFEFVNIIASRLIPLENGGYCHVKNGELLKYEYADEDDEEAPESTVEHTEKQEEEEKPKKKKRKTQKKRNITIQDPVSPNKESESCPKCFRASSFTREANEKLKLEKIATKQLRKRLAELEMENLKQDEKICAQKKELEEKEERIRSLLEQLEEVPIQLNDNKENIKVLNLQFHLHHYRK